MPGLQPARLPGPFAGQAASRQASAKGRSPASGPGSPTRSLRPGPSASCRMISARAAKLEARSRFGRPSRAIPAHGHHERPQKPDLRRNRTPNTACPKERARGDPRHDARACLIHTIVSRGKERAERGTESGRQHRVKRTFSKTCRPARQPACQPAGTVERDEWVRSTWRGLLSKRERDARRRP